MADEPPDERANQRAPRRALAGNQAPATPDGERTLRPGYDQLRTLVQDRRQPPASAVQRRALEERFELQEPIGRGGSAVVYRAYQRALHRDVAIKRLKRSEGPLWDSFVTEARVSAELDHPGVIPVHDLIETDKGPALVLKLVRGRTWKELLRERRNIGSEDTDTHLEILLSAANAVAFAHSRGFLHNDLKPSNVLVGEFGEVFVADWGLVTSYRDPPALDSVAPHKSKIDQPTGTPAYWAPELARGAGAELGPWTDVYLLGSALYEVLMGRPPHAAEDMVQSLMSAVAKEPPPLDASVSPGLAAICRKAMARAVEDRYPTVVAFQEALRAFRRYRESERITSEATGRLEQATGLTTTTLSSGAAYRIKLYTDLAEIVSAFKQALLLWPENQLALAGEQRATRTMAKTALFNGDLGVAEVQIGRLARSDPAAAALSAKLTAAKDERARAARGEANLRRRLAVAVALLVVGLSVAVVAINVARRDAEASHALAAEQLAGVRRLADVKLLGELTSKADALWPALPGKAAAMEEWLVSARALTDRLEGHRAHLSLLRGRAVETAPTIRFATPEEQWEHDTLAALVTGLESFESDAESRVEQRLAFARSLRKATLEDPRRAWERAVASIADPSECPAYRGLRLSPQLGLIPLGRDPRSGLWEFAHLASGEPAVRGSDGTLIIGEATGVVLVLVPGGTFSMGSELPGGRRGRAGPHIDPDARPSEGPVHEITLAPFFLGKYEVTQSQWVRVAGKNPSAYPEGFTSGGKRHTGLHPVEQIGWTDAKTMLGRLALDLPTEAQWEYAARSGTTTVYFTGDSRLSLAGSVNLADRFSRDNGGPGSWLFEPWLDDGYVVHSPVGAFRPNNFGLHDMIGNVWEFVEDRYGSYTMPVKPGTGERIVPTETPRVFRGGGFRSSAVHARSSDRYSLYAPDYRGFDVGVRAARAVE